MINNPPGNRRSQYIEVGEKYLVPYPIKISVELFSLQMYRTFVI